MSLPPEPAQEALTQAIRSGDLAGLERALSEGASPLAQGSSGERHTPLGLALCLSSKTSSRLAILARLLPFLLEPAEPPLGALSAAAELGREDLVIRWAALVSPTEKPFGCASSLTLCAQKGLCDALAALAPRVIAEGRRGLGESALREAAEAGQASACAELAAHFDANAKSERGETALMIAAAGACPQTALALIPFSNAIDRDRSGRSPLMIAARSGLIGAIEELARFNSPDGRDQEGLSALMIAAQNAQPEALRALLPLSNPRLRDAKGRDALMLAVAARGPGSAECVRALLSVCDTSEVNDADKSALVLAIEAQNAAAAALLITPRLADSAVFEGHTPLMIAALRGGPKVVAALLPLSDPLREARGLEGATLGSQGRHAASMALARQSHAELAAMLPKISPFDRAGQGSLLLGALCQDPCEGLSRFLDLALETFEGQALPEDCSEEFMWALARGHAGWAERLAPSARLEDSERANEALIWAAYGSPAWVEPLLAHADPMSATVDGASALMWAAYGGRLEAVKRLAPLSDPARVNAAGFDALMAAVDQGHFECAQALLPLCDPKRVNRRGESCFFLAVATGDDRLISLLAPFSDATDLDLRGRDAFDAALLSPPLRVGYPAAWDNARRLILAVASSLRRLPEHPTGLSLARRIRHVFRGEPRVSDEAIEELARAAQELIELNAAAPAKLASAQPARRL